MYVDGILGKATMLSIGKLLSTLFRQRGNRNGGFFFFFPFF